MKKISLIIGLQLMIAVSYAQYKITLVMSATPPATLSEWGNRREVLTLLVSGQGSIAKEVKIKTTIKAIDGTVIGTTDIVKARAYTFTTPNTILTANDVLPLDNMIFTGKYRNSLDKTGKLPSDNYTLCVQLVSPPDYGPASEEQCKSFFLATMQLPILMKPYNEEKLEPVAAQTAITFRWTPVVPQQREPVLYRLQVFEVLEHQTTMQALRSNQPLLDQEIRGATQYIWRPQLLFNTTEVYQLKAQNNNTVKSNRGTEYRINDEDEADSMQLKAQNNNTVKSNRGLDYKINNDEGAEPIKKIFIWSIQTLDMQGRPITQTDGSGEARSEPVIFYIVPNKAQQKVKEKPSKGLKDTLKTQV